MTDWKDQLLGAPGTPQREEFDAFYIAYMAEPRDCCGRPRGTPDEERLCRRGTCVEYWCPCGAFTGDGFGPVGCPCRYGWVARLWLRLTRYRLTGSRGAA